MILINHFRFHYQILIYTINLEIEVTGVKLIPLNKQSKKEQKKYYARSRRDWNGLKPTTRVVKSKKVYDRKKLQKPDYE